MPAGQSTQTRDVDALVKEMMLSISIDDFSSQHDALKSQFATQYGVHPSLVTSFANCWKAPKVIR